MIRKAEIFDYLQYFYHTTGYNDHQLHCVIHFEHKLNATVLRKAVTYLLKVIPILCCAYKNKEGNSYWEPNTTLMPEDYFLIVTGKEAFDAFTYSKTQEDIGPQIKFCLLNAKKDSLSIILNHMVSDAAGLKQCLYLLSDIYSNLLNHPAYIPDFKIDGDRGIRNITERISFKDKLKILLFQNNDNNQSSEYKYPTDTGEDISPFILTHTLSATNYEKVISFCQKYHVTVNDVLLTALFRVLSGKLHLNGKSISIPIMIDMRRYLPNKEFRALCNLSSTVIITATVFPNDDFMTTLRKVKAETSAKKNNNIGLNVFLKLDMLFQMLKGNSAYYLLQSSINNPKICMTNIGIIDSKKLIFGNTPVTNAYMCGSIKYRPYFQLAVSTFGENLNFCVNLYGSAKDRENFEKLFSCIDQELKTVLKEPVSTLS